MSILLILKLYIDCLYFNTRWEGIILSTKIIRESTLQNYKTIIIVLFVETPRKFITAKLSIRKPGSSSVLIICDLFNSHALFIYKTELLYVLSPCKHTKNLL